MQTGSWKRIAVVATLLVLAAGAAAGQEYKPEPNSWRAKLLDLAKSEPKAREAIFSQALSLWVSVADDGTPRDGYASYFCLLATDAGRPEGEMMIVHVWDHAFTLRGEMRQLGKAVCR